MNLTAMQQGKRTAAQQRWASELQRTKAIHSRCRCLLSARTTANDLAKMGGGCTMPDYCCPRLDALRRFTGPVVAVTPPKGGVYDPFASQVLAC